MRALALTLGIVLFAAGCITPTLDTDGLTPGTLSVGTLRSGALTLEVDTATGPLATLRLTEGAGTFVTFPDGVLVIDAEGRYVPALGPVELPGSGELRFLPPYGAATLEIQLDTGDTFTLDVASASERLVSGRFAVEELARQRDLFPHRMPGHESYAASQAYFVAFFESLGMDVEVDPFGTMALDDVKLPVGPRPGPSSVANVVAYKRGTMSPERYLVVGGHYDVVEGTVEGAFDNTGGAVATMALARAFANVTTAHTIVFGLWGGEEDGILGSQFWVTTNPDKLPFIDGYYNFDVTPLAWPAPAIDPAPLVVAAGPDSVDSDALFGFAQQIKESYLQIPAEFVYEGVVQGQATGAGVNAQSDHTPFMARGIPVYFPFTSRVDDVFAIIHSDTDTLENLTKYALYGAADFQVELTPEERMQGEDVLARSFETNMYLAFYWFALTDAGVLPSLAPTDGLPLPEVARLG